MFTKLFKSEGGFTLVELLVTISILGVLFGIVTLTLTGVGSDAQDSVCASETHLVQSALDVWMAINPSATAPSLTPAAKIDGTSGTDLYTDYLRGTTVGGYTITAGIALQDASCPFP